MELVPALSFRYDEAGFFEDLQMLRDRLSGCVHSVQTCLSSLRGCVLDGRQRNHQVIQTGPYALARRPSYLGGLLSVVGIGLGLGRLVQRIQVQEAAFAKRLASLTRLRPPRRPGSHALGGVPGRRRERANRAERTRRRGAYLAIHRALTDMCERLVPKVD